MGFWVEKESYRGHHLFGVRIPEKLLLDKLQNTLEQAKIVVSVRGRSMRVSPHVYNEEQDLNRLVACLQNLL